MYKEEPHIASLKLKEEIYHFFPLYNEDQKMNEVLATPPSSLASLIYESSSLGIFLVFKDIYESTENIDDISLS